MLQHKAPPKRCHVCSLMCAVLALELAMIPGKVIAGFACAPALHLNMHHSENCSRLRGCVVPRVTARHLEDPAYGQPDLQLYKNSFGLLQEIRGTPHFSNKHAWTGLTAMGLAGASSVGGAVAFGKTGLLQQLPRDLQPVIKAAHRNVRRPLSLLMAHLRCWPHFGATEPRCLPVQPDACLNLRFRGHAIPASAFIPAAINHR